MNQKYAAIFLAALMVMSVFSYFVASFVGNSNDVEDTSTDMQDAPGFEVIGGTHFSSEMNSLSDGLAFTPKGMTNAIYVDYSRTYGTPLQDYNVTDLYMYYNTMMITRYSAYNITGSYGFEADKLNPEVVGFNYTIADSYNGYSLLFRGNGIYNIIGTPTLLGDVGTLEKVIDVASGTSPASDEFNEIMGYVTPGAEYQVLISTDSLADQHYLEYRNMNDGNYSKTEIFLNPLDNTVDTVSKLEANCTARNLVYNTSTYDDGNILKVVVTANTTNFINLVTEQYY
jgi:surface glycoprotein (TIGR04207 family)